MYFEVSDVRVDPSTGVVRYVHDGDEHVLEADLIAGCDGFHGICRPAIADVLTVYEREYPFGWMGILAHAAPTSEELIYAHHERGFALASLRSPEVSRLYLQCEPDEEPLGRTSAIWEELDTPLRHVRQPRRDLRQGRHADALVRGRADAARAAVPGRRRGAHRSARRAPRA